MQKVLRKVRMFYGKGNHIEFKSDTDPKERFFNLVIIENGDQVTLSLEEEEVT